MPPRPPPTPYKPLYPTPPNAKNVLFLAVDDMRPSLGAYNFTLEGQPSHSPNIDKLAREGTLFTHAYVQYAYCSPSRNSFMTGRRPDTTKVWEFQDHFREEGVGTVRAFRLKFAPEDAIGSHAHSPNVIPLGGPLSYRFTL
jgi:arylsulfatase A-like enzyme